MGAILGIAIFVVLLVILGLLWAIGAMRPKQRAAPATAQADKASQSGRTSGID
jgi:hypothetical protein